MEDVRVRILYKGSLEWSGDQHIAASVTAVPDVPGIVSTASDYVYDEAEHGPVLAQLLHGKKSGKSELVVELEDDSPFLESELESESESETGEEERESGSESEEEEDDTAVLEKEGMELENDLRKELGTEEDEKLETEEDEKLGTEEGEEEYVNEEAAGAVDDGEFSMNGTELQKLVSKERYDDE